MAGFRSTRLVLYDPEAVLSKLDVKLRMPTLTGPPFADASPWVSQIPHITAEAVSQSQLIQKRISNYQGSSPTIIFDAVKQLAKGTEAITYEMTLLRAELRTTQAANKALAKRRRAKRTRLQEGGTLSVEDARGLMAKKDSGHQKKGKEIEKEDLL